MNTKTVLTLAMVLLVALGFGVLRATSQGERAPQAAVGTAFTYQGHLNDGGSPANGSYDFQFSLHDAASGGVQIGSTVTVAGLAVSNGLFTASLDFGAGAFDGNARFLAISVAQAGTGSYATLSPRQEITAAPAALSLPNVSFPANRSSLVFETTTAASSAHNIEVVNNSQTGNSLATVYMRANDVTGQIFTDGLGTAQGVTGKGFFLGTYSSYPVGFYANASERIRISTNGNVGIGTTVPSALLDVAGDAHAERLISDTSVLINDQDEMSTVQMSFFNNVARFRTSGTGPGATNGFSFQTVGNTEIMRLTGSGDLNVYGKATVDVLEIDGGADLSEWFDVREGETVIAPGMVVCIDPENEGALAVCDSAYAKTVAGAISGAGGVNTGMTMGQDGSIADGDYPVALTGRIYVWADASYGTIEAGDMLTTSDTAGHVMVASDAARAYGTVIGKAMTSLESGTGLILVLVSLQ